MCRNESGKMKLAFFGKSLRSFGEIRFIYLTEKIGSIPAKKCQEWWRNFQCWATKCTLLVFAQSQIKVQKMEIALGSKNSDSAQSKMDVPEMETLNSNSV